MRAKELTNSEWLFPLASKDAPMGSANVVDILKAVRDVLEIEDLRLHDLRRTAATYMGEMGIPDRDIEGVLNHISARRGVTRRHYDRARREDGKREALLLWAIHLERLVGEARAERAQQSKETGCWRTLSTN
jgi:integrase